MKKDYLPSNLQALSQWLKNFALKLAFHAEKLGIKPEVLARVQNDALFVEYLSLMIVQTRATMKGLNGFKNLALYSANTSAQLTAPVFNFLVIPDGVQATGAIIKNIRKVVRHIKSSGEYTTLIGGELGIITGGAAENSRKESSPPVKLEALFNDRVRIKFKKYGNRAIRIEMRREDEENFSFIDVGTHSPFMDATKSVGGRAEVRYYRFIYYNNNEPTGVYSAVYIISTRP